MQISRLIIPASVLFIVSGINAQTYYNNHISWWPAYYLKYAVNKKWTINTDLQIRNFARQPVLGLIGLRTGAHYSISSKWSTAIGGAWFHQQQHNADKKKLKTDELRLWEELKHELKLNNWNLINQFRTEQRHWVNTNGIAFRFRYRLAAVYSFSEKWKAMTGNELMWQHSKTRENWDQNRLWLGGEYAFNKTKQVQVLLMNWWQFNTHTRQLAMRVNFVQSINGSL